MKKALPKPLKTVITVVCILAVLAVVAVGAFLAIRYNAEKKSIGREAAVAAALADAGVDAASAHMTHTNFEYEHGDYYYEVEFYANGAEYEYLLRASDGAVVHKDVDKDSASALPTYPNAAPGAEAVPASASASSDERPTANVPASGTDLVTPPATGTDIVAPTPPPTQPPVTDGGVYIGVDSAKAIALAHAGLDAGAVTFTRAKLENDDGRKEYDIEFYSGNVEYEYSIDALTGAILEFDSEIDD